MDGEQLAFDGEFDAVFSNAASALDEASRRR